MTYLLNLEEQGRIFVLSLGFGFCIGILYDVMRLFRVLLKNTKSAFLVFDLLYMLTAAILTFLFLLTATGGSIRAYALLGEFLGFFIYFVTIGTVLAACFDRLAYALQTVTAKISQGIKRVLKRIFTPLKRKISKNTKKVEKKTHFSIRKSKIHLKSLGNMLYNQHIRKHAKQDSSKT